MIICILILLFSILLSSVIPNLIIDFIPFFIIASIIVIGTFNVDKKDIYLITFIFGIIYDLLYTDLVILHAFLFVSILFLSLRIMDGLKNFFLMIALFYLICVLYSLFMYLFSISFSSLNIYIIINLLSKSFLINTLYFMLLYFIFIGIKCLIGNKKIIFHINELGDWYE